MTGYRPGADNIRAARELVKTINDHDQAIEERTGQRKLATEELGHRAQAEKDGPGSKTWEQIAREFGCSVRTLDHAREAAAGLRPRSSDPQACGLSDHEREAEMTPQQRHTRSRPKMTRTEQARLADYAVTASKNGYPNRLIAEAAGTSENTIADLVRRITGPRARSEQNRARPPGRLEPIRWRDRDQVIITPGYQKSTTRIQLHNLLISLRQDNAVNRYAFDFSEAARAGDQEWIASALAETRAVAEYIHRLVAVGEDDDARNRAITDPRERDDIGPHLRAVRPA